jgi:hypothetical protein
LIGVRGSDRLTIDAAHAIGTATEVDAADLARDRRRVRRRAASCVRERKRLTSMAPAAAAATSAPPMFTMMLLPETLASW